MPNFYTSCKSCLQMVMNNTFSNKSLFHEQWIAKKTIKVVIGFRRNFVPIWVKCSNIVLGFKNHRLVVIQIGLSRKYLEFCRTNSTPHLQKKNWNTPYIPLGIRTVASSYPYFLADADTSWKDARKSTCCFPSSSSISRARGCFDGSRLEPSVGRGLLALKKERDNLR